MKLDELKQDWQQHSSRENNQQPAELMQTIAAQSLSFNRETQKRTWIGTAMFLLPIPLILFVFRIAPETSALLGLIEVVLIFFLISCAVIVVTNGIVWKKSLNTSLPVKEYIYKELQKSDRQAWLFNQLKWWFWAPLLLGWVILMAAILTGHIQASIFSLLNVVTMPLLAFIGIRSSHRYLAENILPWQKSFRDSLEALGES